jgi:plastocyanin
MNKPMITDNLHLVFLVLVMISTTIIIATIFGMQNSIFATTESVTQGEQPNINASSIYDTHSMVLGNNVKNLVILIPNEAHEPVGQQKNQLPLANQPYIPQNAVVNVGTVVTWFNGDVDHDHMMTIVDSRNSSAPAMYESGNFVYNTATKPLTFNDTGIFNYQQRGLSFAMNGTIRVINQPNPLISSITAFSSNNANATTGVHPDTVGTMMVPAKDLDQYVSTLTSKGLNTDSTHTFEDLRGGQKGTGPEQAYIVWISSGMNLDQVITALKEITSTLPYS